MRHKYMGYYGTEFEHFIVEGFHCEKPEYRTHLLSFVGCI